MYYVLCLQNVVNPLLDKTFLWNKISECYFGIILKIGILFCFLKKLQSNIYNPIFLCQPPSDCTQFPEMHNQLSLLPQPFLTGAWKNIQLQIQCYSSWMVEKVHQNTQSLHKVGVAQCWFHPQFIRKDEYIVYMPQTQGLLLKSL